jgi:hypothetical protein
MPHVCYKDHVIIIRKKLLSILRVRRLWISPPSEESDGSFFTLLTGAHHWFQRPDKWIKITHCHLISLRSTFPSVPRSWNWAYPFGYSYKNVVYSAHHGCYIPLLSQSSSKRHSYCKNAKLMCIKAGTQTGATVFWEVKTTKSCLCVLTLCFPWLRRDK